MLTAQQDSNESGLRNALNAVFSPLSIEPCHNYTMGQQPLVAALNNQGKGLVVVDQHQQKCWLLSHAMQGERLFNKRDERTAKLVVSLYQLVARVSSAYEEGVQQERLRIRRDMHDDLGAKLLHLLHKTPDESKPLVREAIADLRNLLKNMEGDDLTLTAAIEHWHDETTRRCTDHNVRLEWQCNVEAKVLSMAKISELTRILREAVSNALRHSKSPYLRVTLESHNESLHLRVENEGVPLAEGGAPSGLRIMQERATKMAGRFELNQSNNTWQVKVSVPL